MAQIVIKTVTAVYMKNDVCGVKRFYFQNYSISPLVNLNWMSLYVFNEFGGKRSSSVSPGLSTDK